jgi:hypothetical protein
VGKSNPGLLGEWNYAVIIIAAELLIAGIGIYFFLRRRRPLVPAPSQVMSTSENVEMSRLKNRELSSVNWDELLPEKDRAESLPRKAYIDIIKGKVVIPGPDSSSHIEINTMDSRLRIALEYDPASRKGAARIIAVETITEYEKTKEMEK